MKLLEISTQAESITFDLGRVGSIYSVGSVGSVGSVDSQKKNSLDNLSRGMNGIF